MQDRKRPASLIDRIEAAGGRFEGTPFEERPSTLTGRLAQLNTEPEPKHQPEAEPEYKITPLPPEESRAPWAGTMLKLVPIGFMLLALYGATQQKDTKTWVDKGWDYTKKLYNEHAPDHTTWEAIKKKVTIPQDWKFWESKPQRPTVPDWRKPYNGQTPEEHQKRSRFKPRPAQAVPETGTVPTTQPRVAAKQVSPLVGKGKMVEEGSAAFKSPATLDESCQNLLNNGLFKTLSQAPTQTLVREIICPHIANKIAAIAKADPEKAKAFSETALKALQDATITTDEIYAVLGEAHTMGVTITPEQVERVGELKAQADKGRWTSPTFTAEDYKTFSKVLLPR